MTIPPVEAEPRCAVFLAPLAAGALDHALRLQRALRARRRPRPHGPRGARPQVADEARGQAGRALRGHPAARTSWRRQQWTVRDMAASTQEDVGLEPRGRAPHGEDSRWLTRWTTSPAPTTAARSARRRWGRPSPSWAGRPRGATWAASIFIDVRDREGLCQVVARPEVSTEAHAARRPRARRVRDRGGGRGGGALAGDREPEDAHRRDRGAGPRDPRPVRGAHAALPDRGRDRDRRRTSASSTATSTCAGRGCSATSGCATS